MNSYLLVLLLCSLKLECGRSAKTSSTNSPPRIVSGFKQFLALQENVPVGTILMNLITEDGDGDKLTYTLLPVAGSGVPIPLDYYLRVNFSGPAGAETAVVNVNNMIDREVYSRIIFKIMLNDRQSGGTVVSPQITVVILDENDNAPLFMNLPYKVSIKENTPPDTLIFTDVVATDRDLNPQLTFSLGQNNDFAIDRTTGNVKLIKKLDYEESSQHQVEIIVKDNDDVHNATTYLVVTVIDVENKPPKFTKEAQLVSVKEDTKPGTILDYVAAEDGDTGIRNQINYTLVGGNHDSFDVLSNGSLVLTKPIDRDNLTSPSFTLTVMAYEVVNSGSNQMWEEITANTTVTVTVIDVNDEKPTFNRDVYNATVQEVFKSESSSAVNPSITFTPAGLQMVVTDKDLGVNAYFNLSIENDAYNAFEIFPVEESYSQVIAHIKVVNASILDFEKLESVSINVVARETRTSSHSSSTAKVNIFIKNLNDNDPKFERSSYDFSITEQAQPGTLISNSIRASDNDKGKFGVIEYSIKGSSADLFRINNSTGALYTNTTEFDAEKINIYYINIQALDGGGSRGFTSVSIKILDENDETPEFRRNQYKGAIAETDTDRFVLQVEATDGDATKENYGINYTVNQGAFSDHFNVTAAGNIFVIKPIDRENDTLAKLDGVITLVITAHDTGRPSLKSSVNVSIRVQDENDNAPVFNKHVYTASFYENRTEGFVVHVGASDGDASGSNKELIYRISSPCSDMFTIDDNQNITIIKDSKFDYEKKPVYNCLVKVYDKGVPQLEGNCTVVIRLLDVNDEEPTFSKTSYSTRVQENATTGSLVFKFTATDPDTDSQLEYELVKGETSVVANPVGVPLTDVYKSWFDINPLNGELLVNNTLDREMVKSVTLTVRVTDSKAPKTQTATASLTITLIDVNDYTPKFRKFNQPLTLSESSPVGTLVVDLVADDYDEDDELKFHLIDNSSGVFKIESYSQSQSAQVKLNKNIDRETTKQLTFVAQVQDKAGHSSTMRVNVTVEDANDNDPVFIDFKSPIHVPENKDAPFVAVSVNATDKDEDENGRIEYSLKPDGVPFSINKTTGEITVTKTLDRENQSSYKLSIEAKDSAPSPRTVTKILDIVVDDENDNQPRFTKCSENAEVLEDASRGFPVTKVMAVDGDKGENAEIRYTCCGSTNASLLFKVDSVTGQLSVNESLKNQVGHYNVVITASDNGSVPLSATCTIKVQIKDVNDNAPTFIGADTFYVMENATIGTEVGIVKVMDLDEGKNGEIRLALVQLPNSQDWKYFDINNKTGSLMTATKLDREKDSVLYVTVEAYDLGEPRKSVRQIFTVYVKDVNDNKPEFDRSKYPLPYQLKVEENTKPPVQLGSVGLAEDKDFVSGSLNATPICYFIEGGTLLPNDLKKTFELEMFSGNLTLLKPMDREVLSFVDLYIKASDVCNDQSGRVKRETGSQTPGSTSSPSFDLSDKSMLQVRVMVIDVNDNRPVFKETLITAGVTSGKGIADDESPYVIRLKDHVSDEDEAGLTNMTFVMMGSEQVSSQLKSLLEESDIKGPYFEVGRSTGDISAKVAFPDKSAGHISFGVNATDNGGLWSTTKIRIYLVTDKSRVRVIINRKLDDVSKKKEDYKAFFQNMTGLIVNIDSIATHTEGNKKVESRTDMYIHAVKDNEVLTSGELLDVIDDKFSGQEARWQGEFYIIEVQPALDSKTSAQSASEMYERVYIPIAVAIIAFLFLLLLLLIFLMWTYRKSYRRKLRAATAIAFSTDERDGLNQLEMPGTNQHTFEGSNPMYLETYENRGYEDDETASNNSVNSLDANEINELNMYDEQEISMDLYNDEADHYDKIRPNYLDAALKEHEEAKNQRNIDMNKTNDDKNDMPSKELVFTNPSFQEKDNSIFNNMQTTEI